MASTVLIKLLAALVISCIVVILASTRKKKAISAWTIMLAVFVMLLCAGIASLVSDLIPLDPARFSSSTETVRVTALGTKNEKASNNELYMTAVYANGKKLDIDSIAGPGWYKQNNWCIWRKSEDPRWPPDVEKSDSVELMIPCGKDRYLEFYTNIYKGIVQVAWDGGKMVIDCYSEKDGRIRAELPDSPIDLTTTYGWLQLGIYSLFFLILFYIIGTIVMQLILKEKVESFARSIPKGYFSLWKNMTGWKLFFFYLLHYTILFIIMWCVLFSPFASAGKTYIWRLDGIPIWFTRLLYNSKTTGDAIADLLAGKGWRFPVYDFELSPMVFSPNAEPLSLISAIWPTDKIDILYNILVILRFYLVGVSFSLLAFRFTKKPWAILIGAISYCFCGFSLFAGMRHPSFLAPMIMLPLLILGCEMILNKERSVLFPLAVFVSCISDSYFAAMLGLVTVLYGVLRFFCLYAKKSLLKELPVLVMLILNGIIGILLSGIILLPSLLVYTDTGRIGRSVFAGEGLKQYFSYSVFHRTYYQRFIGAFTVTPGTTQYWTCLGFTVLAIPTLFMMFLRWEKKERILRISFILLTIMLCLPIIGYIMSGFTTFANRWCFAYSLCVSMIITIEAPKLASEKQWRNVAVLSGCLIYVILCMRVVQEAGFRNQYGLILLLGGMMTLVILKNHPRVFAFSCIAITVVSCYLSSVILYSPAHRNYVSEFVDTGKAYSLLDNAQYGAFADSGFEDSADGLYRVACENISRNAMSSSFYYDISGLSFNPLVNKYYLQWLNELEVADKGQNNLHYGPDGRFGILSLAGAKYYVDDCSKAFALPYGFNLATHSQQGNYENNILENEYALPIGYTYDRYLSISDYESLNAIQKQEIQLRAAALANTPASNEIEHGSLECAAKQIPVSMECDGVVIDHGTAVVEKQNATIELTFEGMPNCETYLRINGMDLTSGNSSRKWTIRAYSDEIRAEALFMSDGDQYSNGLKSQVLNLGYSEDARSNCKIVFPSKGTFLLDDLEIWCVPVTEYAEHIDTLREDVLENVETNWRGLKGTISVSSDKILCLSIPYDEGWTAYVDGKSTDLMQANTAWMAIELSAGEHEIELRYWTPGLTAGICLTVLGIIALVWYLLRRKKEKISEYKMSITSDDVL